MTYYIVISRFLTAELCGSYYSRFEYVGWSHLRMWTQRYETRRKRDSSSNYPCNKMDTLKRKVFLWIEIKFATVWIIYLLIGWFYSLKYCKKKAIIMFLYVHQRCTATTKRYNFENKVLCVLEMFFSFLIICKVNFVLLLESVYLTKE